MGKLDPPWEAVERPGYFGRRRDEKIASYNALWGEGNWKLGWLVKYENGDVDVHDFAEACKVFYEESYYRYLKDRPDDLKYICSFGECIDNDDSNVLSGLDYTKQESWATHIQDIAVRNVLARLGLKFENPNKAQLLIIRSHSDNGFRFNPGNVPFYDASLVMKPSRAPKWAQLDSVEDFWQSNKWILVKRDR